MVFALLSETEFFMYDELILMAYSDLETEMRVQLVSDYETILQ